MASILSAALCLTFAGALALAWRAHRLVRVWERRGAVVGERETALLAAVRGFTDASRESSESVLRALVASLGFDGSEIDVVLVFSPDGEDLACIHRSGARAEHYASLRVRRDSTVLLPGRAAVCGHRVRAVHGDGTIVATDRAALAVPMYDERRLSAVVYASSLDPSAFDEEERIVRTIELATAPYVMACEREADRADATYDGLTGLHTPRAFRAKLQEEMVRARFANRGAVTLWFVDTDRFKSVNDTHGHAAGDVVLQAMADLLRIHTVPEVDMVGRNGGDEFCAMLYGVQKTVAIERAQRFCDAVRGHDFGIPVRLTASVGVASFSLDAKTTSDLLEVADAAMYHSKRAGRDRVAYAVEAGTFAVFSPPSAPRIMESLAISPLRLP